MAGLSIEGVPDLEISDLKGATSEILNDGTVITNHIKSFLNKRSGKQSFKVDAILNTLTNCFSQSSLYTPRNGESILKTLFFKIKTTILPLINSKYHLDLTGLIFNKLSDWVAVENDSQNDVVLTPRYVTKLMVKLARTNRDSFVLDSAMGSAGFLISAMEEMIKDAKANIQDKSELDKKISHIKEEQLVGVEILQNIYMLAALNMILMGDGSSKLFNNDSLKPFKQSLEGQAPEQYIHETFPTTVFLLNPPYSKEGKGFIFVEAALKYMTTGYACILIQENAGSGNGLPYTKKILENNTLLASIHMADIFKGKAGVQTAIYLFKANVKHDPDALVTFIDFSNDGYVRQNRKKSTQEVNLKDVNDAKGRYQEIIDIILGHKKKTNYFNEENGTVIKDTISLDGNDWTFAQHRKIDLTPTEEDFKKTVADYLAWKVANIIKGGQL